jgi:hypothetical protein
MTRYVKLILGHYTGHSPPLRRAGHSGIFPRISYPDMIINYYI